MPATVPRRRRLLKGVVVIAVLAVAIWKSPDVVKAFCLWRGNSALVAHDGTRAIVWINRAAWLDENDGEVHYLLARAHRQLKQFDRVEQELLAAHRLGWNVKQLEREQWLALAQTGQFDSIQNHWGELLTNAGDDGPEVSNAYVQWCLSRFGLNDALRALTAWEKDFPADAQPRYLRGLLNEALLSWEKAIHEHRTAVAIDATRNDARFRLAECLMQRLQVQEAEEIYRQCLAKEPTLRAAAVGRAKALLKLGRLDEAREILTEEIAATPNSAETLAAMGDLEWMSNRPQEALKYLEPACRLQPENPSIHYALGRALQAVGNRDAAREHFAFVKEAQAALDKLGVQMEQLVRRPDDIALRYNVALTTWKYKSRPNGAKWFHSLLEYAPDHVPTHAALAEHYALLGDVARSAHHRRLAEQRP